MDVGVSDWASGSTSYLTIIHSYEAHVLIASL